MLCNSGQRGRRYGTEKEPMRAVPGLPAHTHPTGAGGVRKIPERIHDRTSHKLLRKWRKQKNGRKAEDGGLSSARGTVEQFKEHLKQHAVCDEPILYDESALEVTTPTEVQQEKYKKYQTEKYVPQPHYQRED